MIHPMRLASWLDDFGASHHLLTAFGCRRKRPARWIPARACSLRHGRHARSPDLHHKAAGHCRYRAGPQGSAQEARIARMLASRPSSRRFSADESTADIRYVTPRGCQKTDRLGSIHEWRRLLSGQRENTTRCQTGWLLQTASYDASMDSRVGRAAITHIWGTDAVPGHNNAA